MLPESFIARVKELVPEVWLDEVMQSYSVKRPTTFRANTLKISTDDLVSELTSRGISYERVGWYGDAFMLLEDDSRKLTETDLYNEGKLYVQSLSSMIPPMLLDPQPNDLILDLCAAPGSKTTQLSAMMDNTGKIIANDLSTVRLYKLAHNLKLQGVTNTKTRQGKGEEIWRETLKRAPFDRVLADVPCSLEGRFSELDPKSYDGWSEKKVTDLAVRMRMLLLSAVKSVKPGGIVVYSTCTMSPEENEGVVQWVMNAKEVDCGLEDAFQALTDRGLIEAKVLLAQGVTQWRGADYVDEMKKCARIFPNRLMEGFFVAILRRSELE